MPENIAGSRSLIGDATKRHNHLYGDVFADQCQGCFSTPCSVSVQPYLRAARFTTSGNGGGLPHVAALA